MQNKYKPIGLVMALTAKATTRAFENRLIESGGSLSTWLVLLALSETGSKMQADLLKDIGIQGPTLTHHLNAMEIAGLITRTRLEKDRRSHNVEITTRGQQKFDQLKKAAKRYDALLCDALTGQEMAMLRSLLDKMASAALSDLQSPE